MNEPHNPRPLQTVNRLRLMVFIPAFIAVVGILMLGSKLALKFREIEEPSAQDYPPSPTPTAGGQGRPIKPVNTRPQARQTAAVTAKEVALNNSVTSTVRSASGTGTAPPDPNAPVALAATPSILPLVTGGVARSTKALATNGIVGRVFLRGTPPPEKEIPIDLACGKLHPGGKPKTRFYAVGTNGALADVFVVLERTRGLGQWQPPATPVEIRQRNCEYLPYIIAAQAGQFIRVFNDDPVLHNVHPTPGVEGNGERNVAQLPRALPLDFSFPKPELFLRFKCDVHPWMFAYVSVVEHPFFAVSAADGQFALPEPPPGNYTVQFIHRKAGGQLVPVIVQAGKRLAINVTLDITDRNKSEATVTEE